MIQNDEYLESILRDAFTTVVSEDRATMDFYPSRCSAKTRSGEELGACTRALYYDKKGVVAEAPDIKGYLIMSNGSVMGDFLSKCFQKARVAIAPNGLNGETRLRLNRVTKSGVKYAISGRVDQLCTDERGQIIGYEFKTVYSKYKAGRVLGDWRGNYVADPKNIMQIAMYAWWGRSRGIMDWRLTYFYIQGGNEKLARTYYVTVAASGAIFVDGIEQPFSIESIFEKYDLLADSIATNSIPDREYKLFLTDDEVDAIAIMGKFTKTEQKILDKGHPLPQRMSGCTYCEFRTECWSEEELEKYSEVKGIR